MRILFALYTIVLGQYFDARKISHFIIMLYVYYLLYCMNDDELLFCQCLRSVLVIRDQIVVKPTCVGIEKRTSLC